MFSTVCVRYAHIWLVPLIRESPSFACSLTGSNPASSNAVRESLETHLPATCTRHSPSPIIPIAIWESGAKSPEAPSDPILGIDGAILELTIPRRVSTTDGLIPDTPFAREFARIVIIIRTISGSIVPPIPHA